MVSDGRYYLTTPIYYVNAEPHVGHAYTTIMADVIARHRRQRGDEVFLLTGTDEHGSKVADSAAAAGRTPREQADLLSARFRDLGSQLDTTHDFFIRTSDEEHERVVGEVMERLRASGDVYKGSYGGWYCRACEGFYREEELLPGRLCPVHRTPVEWLEEENWFFRLSAYGDRLLDLYESNPSWVRPQSRLNEARRLVEAGLEDLSISRAQIDWGVPVPWDPDQVVYVWVDALFNYYTALTYARPGEDLVARFWPPDLHVMAKDILKFHAVIWPALLMSAGLELPRQLFVHGFVLKGGEKMSKTAGNVIDPFPFIEQYGIDPLRYYLVREVSFGADGIFSAEGFEARYTTELANELGNLLNRTVSMVSRYRDGRVPSGPGGDAALAAEVGAAVETFAAAMDELEVTRATDAAWSLVRRLNRLVEERAPWTLAKDPERSDELDQALHALCEGLRAVAIMLWPVMPGSMSRALAALGQPPAEVGLERAAWGAGAADAMVQPAAPLFPRLEEVAA